MRAVLWVLLLCFAAAPAAAQGPLRLVPVPADAAVMIPPRGAALAPMPSTPPPVALWEGVRAAPSASAGGAAATAAPFAGGVSAALAGGLPLVAGAVLGATLPGSGGAAAPARTR
jgi:hypothetical protein